MANSNLALKEIIKLKEENEKLEKVANFLHKENFEYALKCTQIENVLSKIHSCVGDAPQKLISVSENLCGILQECAPVQGTTNKTRAGAGDMQTESTNEKLDNSTSKVCKRKKAHMVNPHMVNGTVLNVPTITLARVESPLQPQEDSLHKTNKSVDNNASTSSHVNSNTSQRTDSNCNSLQQDFSMSQNSTTEDICEPSSSVSPSHSTVLSGTFQEVKIFVNQIGQDSVNEESRKSTSSRCRSRRAARTSKRISKNYLSKDVKLN